MTNINERSCNLKPRCDAMQCNGFYLECNCKQGKWANERHSTKTEHAVAFCLLFLLLFHPSIFHLKSGQMAE